jgi:hypothetical protein
MPEIVADADQGGTDEQHPVAVGKAHHQIRHADPGQRDRHQQPLATDRIHHHSTRHVGERAGGELTGQNRSDLAEAQVQLPADQRQQQIERRRIPMGHHVAGGDQPHLAKRDRG